MVDKILSALITDVEMELYQVAGVSTQIYSEDIIAAKIIKSFNFIFDDYNWKRFKTFAQFTLDGTTGHTTSAVSGTIKSFDAITKIFPAVNDNALTFFSEERNPLLITGSMPLMYTTGITDIMRVLPMTATGNIVVLGQVYPFNGDPIGSTPIPFDADALVAFTCWQYAVDDATNPGQIDKFQKMFSTKIKQLKANESAEPVALNMGRQGIPTQWGERG